MTSEAHAIPPPKLAPPAPYVIETNDDGTQIVKLAKPVRVAGIEHSRLTIPNITGKHMRHADWSYGEAVSVGKLVSFAAHVVEPEGAIDALPGFVARDLSVEVLITLGKASSSTGEVPSS